MKFISYFSEIDGDVYGRIWIWCVLGISGLFGHSISYFVNEGTKLNDTFHLRILMTFNMIYFYQKLIKDIVLD